MAHSYIDYRGREASIRDVDLVLAMRCVERAQAAAPPSSAFPFPEHWQRELENLVPGGIDLALDRHIAAESERDRFVRALDAAKADLQARGGEVPGEEVDALMGGPSGSYVTPNVPVEFVVAVLDRILEVVRPGETEPAEGGSRQA